MRYQVAYPTELEQESRHFASGVNAPGEVLGLALSGRNVGTTASEIRRGLLESLESIAGGLAEVFVDSGAFSEVDFPDDGPPVTARPIGDAQWVKRLAIAERLAVAFGPRALIVAPDRVGCQATTLERLARYAPQVAACAARRAQIMAKRRVTVAALEIVPYPCRTTGCAGVLIGVNDRGEAINHEREGAAAWRCFGGTVPVCGETIAADDGAGRCPADGAPLTFDPDVIGETCGGLTLRGWNRCAHCGGVWVTRRGIPHTGGGADGRWRLAGGGRSLDAGGVRLRGEGKTSAPELLTLMARISRMPAFEVALERIASGELDAAAARDLAASALAIGDGVEEIES